MRRAGAPQAPGGRGGGERHPLIERVVEITLVSLLALSVGLMAAGIALVVAAGESLPHTMPGVAGLPGALRRLDPAAYLSLGLVVLIVTPVVRVAGAMVVFARERDRRYLLLSAAVLAIMVFSVVLARV